MMMSINTEGGASVGNTSYRQTARSMWAVLFHIGEGNILCAVLPFCIFNCLLLALVDFSRDRGAFGGFSATGHGLLTLLVSFLVISKVNLAYDRYWKVRTLAGDAYRQLRELVQIVVAVSMNHSQRHHHHHHFTGADDDTEALAQHRIQQQQWRSIAVSQIKGIMDSMLCVLQDPSLAGYLARNEMIVSDHGTPKKETARQDDPMAYIHTLRIHLHCSSHVGNELLERICLGNKLAEFSESYNRLLIYASTPIPFPLVQMGRAFLFVWTFSMPLVLLDGPFSDVWTAQVFLFFLTYGFIGLELVSLKLADPFGDGRDDVQFRNIQDATLVGIDHDVQDIPIGNVSPVTERRLRFSQQKMKEKHRRRGDNNVNQQQQQQYGMGGVTSTGQEYFSIE